MGETSATPMKNTILSLLVAVGLIGSASAQAPSGDLANGLVSFYSFNGNANDSVGGNNLQRYGNTSYTSDRFGNLNGSLYLSSENDYATSTGNLGVSGKSDLTVSAWVKVSTDLIYGKSIAIQFGDPTVIGGMFNIAVTPENGGQISNGGNYADVWAPNIGNPFLNAWKLITTTYSGDTTNTKIYLDGQQLTSFYNYNVAKDIIASPLNIGVNGFSLLQSSIDDVGIWNTALSSSQVSQLYTLQSAPEPSSYALFGIGAIGLLMVLRRKKTA
jgi:hypothetical protein